MFKESSGANDIEKPKLQIDKRSIAEFNRQQVGKMRLALAHLNDEEFKKTLEEDAFDLNEVLKYATDDVARENDKFSNMNAMKAEIYLEWFKKGGKF